MRLSDVAHVYDGPEDVRRMGLFNGQSAVNVIISRQPGANIVATVDALKAQLPGLQAALPAEIKLHLAADRTTTIRASLHEVEITLVIATLLVVFVVSIFLRSLRATVVPAVAIVVSLLGTLGVMYLAGFSLNNLSLMALTVATGFVVDDAIVVLENISRHIEDGMRPSTAVLRGAREVGFTVMSISFSLVAVFIPLLFMGGIVGRLFREFAVTMSVAVMISLVISLTTAPMLASLLLRREPKPNRFTDLTERAYRLVAPPVCPVARLGPGQPPRDAGLAGGHGGAQHLPDGDCGQGLLSGAGYGRAGGRPARRPEHFLPRYAEEAHADRPDHPQRPRRRDGRRLHRRFARGRRLPVRDAQAQERARLQPRHHHAAAAEAGPGDRRPRLPQPGTGHARGRPRLQQHLSVQPGGR